MAAEEIVTDEDLNSRMLQLIENNDIITARQVIYNNPDHFWPYEVFLSCIRSKRTRIFKFLLKSPSYPVIQQHLKNTLLRYICKVEWDVSGLIKLAIEGGAEPDTSNRHGENCLNYLASEYSPSLQFWLKNYPVTLYQLRSTLYQTCAYGLQKNCRLLISYAQTHFPTEFDYTLDGNVWYSMVRGKSDTLKLFLEAGLDIHYITNNGWTILHECAYYNKIALLKLALELGVEPNIQTREGNTALHIAVDRGRVNVSKMLLNWGANPEIPNNFGQSAFTIRSPYKSIQTVFIDKFYPKLVSLRTLCLRIVQKEKLDKTGLPTAIFIWPQEINN